MTMTNRNNTHGKSTECQGQLYATWFALAPPLLWLASTNGCGKLTHQQGEALREEMPNQQASVSGRVMGEERGERQSLHME